MSKQFSLILVTVSLIALSASGVAVARQSTQSPSQVQSGKIKPADESVSLFGQAVAMSGNTLIAGAPAVLTSPDDADDQLQGAALVYTYTETLGWTQQAELNVIDAGQETTGGLGNVVAIDGDTALVGASRNTINGIFKGGVWVFQRDGSAWTQQAQLEIDNGDPELPAGFSVALSGDTAVIGQPVATSDEGVRGEAYVFVRSGAKWSLEATLAPTDLAGAENPNEDNTFGQSVAIDGNTLVVGAPQAATDFPATRGAIYIYTRQGSRWTLQSKINNADTSIITTSARMGDAVAIEGDTVVAGAPGEGVGGNNRRGVAHVFVRNNGLWREQARLAARDGRDSDRFGSAVDITNGLIVVGADFANAENEQFSGEFYTFVPVSGSWFERGAFIASDGEFADLLGTSVATNGTIAAGGAPREGNPRIEAGGAVYWGPIADLPEVRSVLLPLVSSQ